MDRLIVDGKPLMKEEREFLDDYRALSPDKRARFWPMLAAELAEQLSLSNAARQTVDAELHPEQHQTPVDHLRRAAAEIVAALEKLSA